MPILTEEERLGTLIAGRYRLESILGQGGTGVVFGGVHTWTSRPVAVKLLKPEFARDLELVRRFLQEARTATKLRHPNVVEVLDMGSERDGTVYLVLELLEGESLGRMLEREGKIPASSALELLAPVMEALALAHEQGIVHRDLKPDNIFLARDATGRTVPKLLDFGMAKMVQSAWGHATRSGQLVGTPFYMSPEQAEGVETLGPPSDVWSMGVIFYRCLSGELPFYAQSPTALLLSIVRDRPKPLRERVPGVSLAVANVVDRALRASPGERYSDMGAMLAALRAAVGREHRRATPTMTLAPDEASGPAVDPHLPVARRSRGMVAVIAGVLLTLLGAGAAGIWIHDADRGAAMSPAPEPRAPEPPPPAPAPAVVPRPIPEPPRTAAASEAPVPSETRSTDARARRTTQRGTTPDAVARPERRASEDLAPAARATRGARTTHDTAGTSQPPRRRIANIATEW